MSKHRKKAASEHQDDVSVGKRGYEPPKSFSEVARALLYDNYDDPFGVDRLFQHTYANDTSGPLYVLEERHGEAGDDYRSHKPSVWTWKEIEYADARKRFGDY